MNGGLYISQQVSQFEQDLWRSLKIKKNIASLNHQTIQDLRTQPKKPGFLTKILRFDPQIL